MMQHGPTSTRPAQVSLTVETEEGLAVERRPQAQRLGSWCTVCIHTVGTGLVTQTKKIRDSFLNNVHKPSVQDPGERLHPYSWQKSHHADGGRARLVSTPKSPTLWILVYSRILQVGPCLIMQRKGLPRINAHELTYLVEGLSSSLLVG